MRVILLTIYNEQNVFVRTKGKRIVQTYKYIYIFSLHL